MEHVSLRTEAIGWTSESTSFSFDWHQVVLYALGIGAGPEELDYVYEARGPKVVPSFALLAAMEPVQACLQRAGAPLRAIIHGGQRLELSAPLEPSDTWITTATIKGMADLRKLGRVVVEAQSVRLDGTLVARSEWDILVQGAGGFTAEPMPRIKPVRPPKGEEPDFSVQLGTHANQSLIYRLSGDTNPLHVDPQVARDVGFERGPILHGLATFGLMTRAVIHEVCEDNPDKLRVISARFSKPVWPGETVAIRGWRAQERVVMDVTVPERGERVLSSCWAQIDA